MQDRIVKQKGIIIGTIGAIITAIIYVMIWKQELYTNVGLGIVTMIYPILLGIAAQVWAKFALQSYISIKQAVLAYFVTILLIFVTEAVVNYLVFVVIDPTAQEAANQALQEFTAQNQNPNATQGFKEPEYNLKYYSIALVSKLLFYTIPGILTALIFRKKQA